MENRAQLLRGLPGDVDLVVSLSGSNRSGKASLLALGEPFPAAAQDRADPLQRVASVAAVTEGLPLEPTPGASPVEWCNSSA